MTGAPHQIGELRRLQGCSTCSRALSTCAMGAFAVSAGLPVAAEQRAVAVGRRRARRYMYTYHEFYMADDFQLEA